MSETRFTRGPWDIRYGCIRDSDEGFGIASKLVPSFGIVAECWPCTTTPETRRELQANARLIAAAPDLYAACARMLSHIDDAKSDSDLMECRAAIVAALTKANPPAG